MAIPKATCPICRSRLTIDAERCGGCGVYTHRLPASCSSRDAALFLEMQSKWRPVERAVDADRPYDNGICWCHDLAKFIAVYGVKSDRNLTVAKSYARGDLKDHLEAPLHSAAIAKTRLEFIGHVPALHASYPDISELADWLNGASLPQIEERISDFKNRSAKALPSISDIVVGVFLTVGSLGLAANALASNSPREDAAITAESLSKALQLRFK